jgi:peptidoglycan/LPS O-acetylase OafA/YrhL
MPETKADKIKHWKRVRKVAAVAMLVGFAAVVLCYFYASRLDVMIGVWALLVIVPHALHTVANRRLRKLEA